MHRPHLEIVDRDIENPMWSRVHDGDKTNPRLIRGQVNIRESAIMELYARGALNDVQFKVAGMFRHLWEVLGGAGAKAIDYGREAVDGGGVRDPISVRQIDAGNRLHEVRQLVGSRNYRLLCAVAGEGRTLASIAVSKRERLTAADNLRSALDDVAVEWKMATRSQKNLERAG